jgi:hypothetical protein
MHKNAMKCNETLSKWCKNKHGASKIIDMFETYQAYAPLLTALSASHLSSWSTGQRLCYPPTLNLMHPEWFSTCKSKWKNLAKMASTSSRRHESRPWPGQCSTSSSYDDIIAGWSLLLRSVKEISYSGLSKTPKACTSCPLLGRDSSLSAGC